MKRIKVLVLCASLKIGGAEKVAQSIALCAPEEEFEFHYLVFHEDVGQYEAELTEKGCRIHRLPEPSDNYFHFLRELFRLIRTHNFHVVHAHTMFNCGLVMLIAKLCGVPVRITHSHSALINGHSIVKTVYETLMRFLILTCSTELVSCGIQAGNRLFGEKAFRERGHLILNGVDICRFRFNEESRRRIRSEQNLENRFVLGHVGHLSEVKNQSFLIRLMPDILPHRPNSVLLLLGDGEDRPMLEKLVNQHALEDHVIFTGNVSNVEDYLSAMDVFVFPSLFEGMPLSLLEVQANGLPCVVSDSVPKDVFVTDLVHPLSLSTSPQEWIGQILGIRRADPGQYGHQLMNSEFSTDYSMARIYQLYRKEF